MRLKIFGPVPSRRLGRSLGINNIPPKNCSYSCIYCQLGRTGKMHINRKQFYSVREINQAVKEKLTNLSAQGENIDYLTFVADGEPTLDINLGEIIKKLKETEKKIAVITNSSLLWLEEVRRCLIEADWVSVKCDGVTKKIWRQIDRPVGKLELSQILNGIKLFAQSFNGTLVSETMLVKGINDNKEELEKIAYYLLKLKPETAYVSIPVRPPAEEFVSSPDLEKIGLAYHIFTKYGINTELLTGDEGDEFSSTGNLEEDLLSITAVHPMRKRAVQKLLDRCDKNWSDILRVIDEGKIIEKHYEEETFYLKNNS